MPKKPLEVNSSQQALFNGEPHIPEPPKDFDAAAVFNSTSAAIHARAVVNSGRTEMDPELAELQMDNMQNGAGFNAEKAEKRVTQARAGETAAEIAQSGITRAKQVREKYGKNRPPTNHENALADRNLKEAVWPNGDKYKPAFVPTESQSPETEIYSPETTAAIQQFVNRTAPKSAPTSEDAQAMFDVEFGEPYKPE